MPAGSKKIVGRPDYRPLALKNERQKRGFSGDAGGLAALGTGFWRP